MLKRTFTVHDNKADMFLSPFYEITVGEAIRAFTDIVNLKDHPVHRHPNDYSLFLLGTYDTQSGQHKNLTTPELLGLAINYLNEPEPMTQTLFADLSHDAPPQLSEPKPKPKRKRKTSK